MAFPGVFGEWFSWVSGNNSGRTYGPHSRNVTCMPRTLFPHYGCSRQPSKINIHKTHNKINWEHWSPAPRGDQALQCITKKSVNNKYLVCCQSGTFDCKCLFFCQIGTFDCSFNHLSGLTFLLLRCFLQEIGFELAIPAPPILPPLIQG